MLILPVNSTGDRRIQVLLGDFLLTVRTYWNPTVPGWYMDLVGSDGIDIALGVALVPEINVVAYDPTITRVYGQFRVFTVAGGENATETSLGNTAQLWWFAPGEFESLVEQAPVNPVLPFNVRDMYAPAPPPPVFLALVINQNVIVVSP